MSGFQLVVLWSDALIWLLLLAGIGLGVLIARTPPLLAAWRRVGANRAGMASATILLAFVLVGLLDSLHYRLLLDGKPGQKASYGIEVLSVLDALAAPLRTHNEKTYSAPFATRLYAKESFDLPGQGTVREFPRLKYGGAHLGDHEAGLAADVGFTACRAGVLAFFAWLAFAAMVAGRVGERNGMPDGSGWRRIWRRETAVAWDAVLLTSLLMLLTVVPLLALAGSYHVFGTDKVGQDVL